MLLVFISAKRNKPICLHHLSPLKWSPRSVMVHNWVLHNWPQTLVWKTHTILTPVLHFISCFTMNYVSRVYRIRVNEERRQHLTFNSLKTWEACNWSYLNRPGGRVWTAASFPHLFLMAYVCVSTSLHSEIDNILNELSWCIMSVISASSLKPAALRGTLICFVAH